MADVTKIVAGSVAGEFFVDRGCIDCDACRQLAPASFAAAGEFSRVYAQPQGAAQVRMALRALLACPVGAIGTRHRNQAGAVMADFPFPIEPQVNGHAHDDTGAQAPGQVYYCGFNSPKSFGGNSYFVRHPDGNWLIDAPRFVTHLVRRFEAWSGVRYIFLSHRDDVADAARFAAHFGARRIIHRGDADAAPQAEIVIAGAEPTRLHPEFKLIPTPGHTRGHCVMLLGDRYLFSGDHLWWEPERRELGASRDYCWYSWPQQTASMARLLDETFQWVLPGHGDRHCLPASTMHRELAALVARMRHEI